MLTAISAGVTAPKSTPTGACIVSISCLATPSSSSLLMSSATLFLLASKPMNLGFTFEERTDFSTGTSLSPLTYQNQSLRRQKRFDVDIHRASTVCLHMYFILISAFNYGVE